MKLCGILVAVTMVFFTSARADVVELIRIQDLEVIQMNCLDSIPNVVWRKLGTTQLLITPMDLGVCEEANKYFKENVISGVRYESAFLNEGYRTTSEKVVGIEAYVHREIVFQKK